MRAIKLTGKIGRVPFVADAVGGYYQINISHETLDANHTLIFGNDHDDSEDPDAIAKLIDEARQRT